MSILLSAYFPEGIVFSADKNATRLTRTSDGVDQDVEVGVATKVVPWPRRRAVVGYCGLGTLAGIRMEEWMRQFAAQTRDFDSLEELAQQLRDHIQVDFERDYPDGTDVSNAGLIVHLGGFRYNDGIPYPAMYYTSNVPGFDDRGRYNPATRQFGGPSDEIERHHGTRPPREYRSWIQSLYDAGNLSLWFNNGLLFPVFNILKGGLWQALRAIRESSVLDLPLPSLGDRVAYCNMAIDLIDSFFRHHYLPRFRSIGGGVDSEWIAWPEN